MTGNKYDYWKLLYRLKKEYENQYTGYYEPTDTGYSDSFDAYLEKNYGLRIIYDNQRNITAEMNVVDEGKYAWCILKHK